MLARIALMEYRQEQEMSRNCGRVRSSGSSLAPVCTPSERSARASEKLWFRHLTDALRIRLDGRVIDKRSDDMIGAERAVELTMPLARKLNEVAVAQGLACLLSGGRRCD